MKSLTTLFQSAHKITDQVLVENITDEPILGLPNKAQLAQNGNHHHQYLCPKDPTTLLFDLKEAAVPEGFFCHDTEAKNCHYLKSTNYKMIDILMLRNWLLDCTFQIVRQPSTKRLEMGIQKVKEILPSCAIETQLWAMCSAIPSVFLDITVLDCYFY